jgi:oxygen-independent coproporphyrinogen-3 oxidase
MDIDALIARYDRRVPRYTSYPTAPHFSDAVGAATAAGWLAALPETASLSLYLHVPFCRTLCRFCGCHTSAVNTDAPLRTYAAALRDEIALVAQTIGKPLTVRQIHWGGGTPSILPAAELRAISETIRRHFRLARDAEIAIEIDPRRLPADRLAALMDMGVTRVSLGVQDFAPDVQETIGRQQSFAATAACAEALRGIGVGSVNLDLVYGLPHQTADGLRATLRQALTIAPERIAVFGYAHVPWMQRHQALIPEASLPDARARFLLREIAETEILAAGYLAIGLDHFAKPGDGLAQAAASGQLRRNFQGYTDDAADALIGLGASAISSLPQGYAQNAPRVPAYRAAIAAGDLAVARGVALDADDRLRRAAIEQVMCTMRLDLDALRAAHGAAADALDDAHPALAELAAIGLIAWDGRHLSVPASARPFLRAVAAAFDRYLEPVPMRHAPTI